MIEDSENNVFVEAWDNHAFITTKQNGIGRSTEVTPEEMKHVADMLYAIAERMEKDEA